MKTYEIKKEDIKGEPVCYGYKAVNWDCSTMGSDEFRYGEIGENLVGKCFKVDGDVKECKWGLHFSKDPAYVFSFYAPLGYNRYFKVAAYGVVIDSKDGKKTVAECIEFLEEYDLIDFINKIKLYDRSSNGVSDSNGVSVSNGVSGSKGVSDSNGVSGSNGVSDSNGVSVSNGVSDSNGVSVSNGVSWSNGVLVSNGVSGSNGVSWSKGVSDSNGVSGCFGIRKCEALKNCLFCFGLEAKKHFIFNKKSNAERFKEVKAKIETFGWYPDFLNFYGIKGDKEWWAFCFPQLKSVDNEAAWAKIPREMLEYIKALPEFDEKVWKKITGK